VVFSIVIGLLMHLIFRGEERDRAAAPQPVLFQSQSTRPLWKTAVYFGAMVGVLVVANWGRPEETTGFFHAVWTIKWWLTGALLAVLAVVLAAWFGRDEMRPWVDSTWGFAKQILPLLLIGVIVAGVLLGRPGGEGLIPKRWVARAVGGNSVWANLFAAVVGAFMYFATLTEVPILKGLIDAGMGRGPSLALLLAGPALSLPNMLVIRSVMGTTKTVVYIGLVVVMATISGLLFGALF
jgi:uncharacterized membrane protein YraQ (UPF0718 family)